MRRRYSSRTIACAIVMGTLAGLAYPQTQPSQKNQQTTKQGQAGKTTNSHFHSEGERVFVQNCARCHTPPEGFSPRISGTIVLHMRVRANLSARDEQELLRYFNP